jgi:hypothetical protein
MIVYIDSKKVDFYCQFDVLYLVRQGIAHSEKKIRTLSATAAYGSDMKLKNQFFCLYSKTAR